ncbi:MAG: DUF3467 domain-containing protein [Anaerolineae bacterium]|nr:DUF3467 domain-containing protein [Anaerolineae bacterium]
MSDAESKNTGGGQPTPPQLRIPADLDPTYANLVRIAHTPTEFVFDFACILPGDRQPSVVSRILMSPLSTKLLLRALNENLSRYESVFGEIKVPEKPTLADHLFKAPPTPEDPSGE